MLLPGVMGRQPAGASGRGLEPYPKFPSGLEAGGRVNARCPATEPVLPTSCVAGKGISSVFGAPPERSRVLGQAASGMTVCGHGAVDPGRGGAEVSPTSDQRERPIYVSLV